MRCLIIDEIIAASVLCMISAFAFFMSIRSFKEKGFLFNNAYIYASEQERDAMNKKPYYRQSGVVFLLLGLVFLLNGFSIFFHTRWISYIAVAIIIIAIVYAIVSSVIIEKQKK